MSDEFTVNPEVCDECAEDGDRVELRGGTCPVCGYES